MKVAAILILYHPLQSAATNLKTYYDHVDAIFVFDNSETESAVKSEIISLTKVEYYQDFENNGIAKRLNEGCRMAIEKGYEWVLTMDQDTTFFAGAIVMYFRCFEQYAAKENVAMFGTQYHRQVPYILENCTPAEVDELITSGMLLNLPVFEKTGEFDEALFIDSVDHEYCIRAKIAGYKIIQFANICILHSLGKEVYRSSIKSLFLLRKNKMVHSPVRYYYMYRNLLYLEKKYKKYDLPLLKKIREKVTHHIQVFLFYGRATRPLITYVTAANRDFKKNKMGKYKSQIRRQGKN